VKKQKNSDSSKKFIDNAEYVKKLEKTVRDLTEHVNELTTENIKLRTTLRDNGLTEDDVKISDVEAICIQQIEKMKEMSASRHFEETDAKIFDILHKNLRMARGQTTEKDNSRKMKKLSIKELNDLVKKGES